MQRKDISHGYISESKRLASVSKGARTKYQLTLRGKSILPTDYCSTCGSGEFCPGEPYD